MVITELTYTHISRSWRVAFESAERVGDGEWDVVTLSRCHSSNMRSNVQLLLDGQTVAEEFIDFPWSRGRGNAVAWRIEGASVGDEVEFRHPSAGISIAVVLTDGGAAEIGEVDEELVYISECGMSGQFIQPRATVNNDNAAPVEVDVRFSVGDVYETVNTLVVGDSADTSANFSRPDEPGEHEVRSEIVSVKPA